MVFKKGYTTIEVKIQNYLKQLGITFFTHQYMNIEHGYQCDILIPSMNMVIEADGTYWHKYPIGRDIDKIRTQELIDKGFKVLRLWEFEIRKMTLKDFEVKLKDG
jgi:very-short-patch-repair endonuclease